MKEIMQKLGIATVLVSLGFAASSLTTPTPSNTAIATVPPSVDWQISEVARDGFSVCVITDPDTQIQYIALYRYNQESGIALAITPRLTKQP